MNEVTQRVSHSSGGRFSRRRFLLSASAAALLGQRAIAQTPAEKIDHTIRISPVSLEPPPLSDLDLSA